MSSPLTRAAIGQEIHLSAVHDAKFKHNRLSVNFVMPLSRKEASNNAVVPFLLRKGTRECPDFSSLNARLAELYGALLDADVVKYGGWQIVQLSLKALDNRFALDNEDLTGQCAELLASLALDPKLGAGALFEEQDVALERQYVLDSIEAEINDKRSYAYNQCISAMCADEPVAIRRYGDSETAEKITAKSATAAYRHMVEKAPIEILFAGAGDSAPSAKIFAERFGAAVRAAKAAPAEKLRTTVKKVTERTETMAINQSKLVLGLRTGEWEEKRATDARRVFAAMFGGTPFSKLFLNVREKLSLCYYCAARFDTATGLLLVDSGVEAENKQKAQDEILRQLAAIQKGDFTEEELANTKLLMKNSITSSGDKLSGLESWYLAQILRGQNTSPEEDAKNIDTITRDEVIAAAQAVALDTVYFLTGNGEGESDE